LKSVDKNHRRFYEKYVADKNEKITVEHVQQVYVCIFRSLIC